MQAVCSMELHSPQVSTDEGGEPFVLMCVNVYGFGEGDEDDWGKRLVVRVPVSGFQSPVADAALTIQALRNMADSMEHVLTDNLTGEPRSIQ